MCVVFAVVAAVLLSQKPDEIEELWGRKSIDGVVQNWITNATKVLETVQQTFPGSVRLSLSLLLLLLSLSCDAVCVLSTWCMQKLAWITTPCPKEGKGYHNRRYVGKLNAAGRLVAKTMGIQVAHCLQRLGRACVFHN